MKATARMIEEKSPGTLTVFETFIVTPSRPHAKLWRRSWYGAKERKAAEARLKWLESMIEKYPESFK